MPKGFRLTTCYASSEGDGDSNNADEEEQSVFVKTSGDTGEYKWLMNNSLETWYHTHPHFGSGF